MPSVIIHEKVGEYVGKRLGLDSYDYYLGLLSPDAPNLEGFGPKEERWMAHQRKKDYDEWRESILKFYLQEKDHYPKDFIKGYYIHVMTDIIYDDYFYAIVKEKIKATTEEDAHPIMREDMTKYSFEGQARIKELLLTKETSYDILNISKERLKKWKKKEITTWKEDNTCLFLTEDIIQHLEEKVYEEVSETIGE